MKCSLLSRLILILLIEVKQGKLLNSHFKHEFFSGFTIKKNTYLFRALSLLEKQDLYSSCCLDIVKILFGSDKNEVRDLLTLEDPIQKDFLNDTGSLKFVNANLASDQRSAVEFAVKKRYFAIVQGPPGTGKTTTLIEIIVQLHRMGKKVSNIQLSFWLLKYIAVIFIDFRFSFVLQLMWQ